MTSMQNSTLVVSRFGYSPPPTWYVIITISISLSQFLFPKKILMAPFEYSCIIGIQLNQMNGLMKTVSLCIVIIFAKIPMKEQLDVIDYRGYEVGKVNVSHASFLILTNVPVHIKKNLCSLIYQ